MPPDILYMSIKKSLNRRRIARLYPSNNDPSIEFVIRKGAPYSWQLLENGRQIRNGIATSVDELISKYREIELEYRAQPINSMLSN